MRTSSPFDEALRNLKSNIVFALREGERLNLLTPAQITLLRRYEESLQKCSPEAMKATAADLRR